ncbi:hypothetical protein OIU79_020121 [Salix purpurea]|uniref:Uncharacterized protein n=1 Tax=Salix purpurea TaxID=77065 RepID=A0A9Q0SKP7_SALPP|nr:hypothetical protein OIU79_020121 [Salix purpurea]
MATVEVVTAQSAFAEEKTEQPIKIETAKEEAVAVAVAAAPEAVAEEPKEEAETAAASEEAVSPAP